eukprot:6213134-Pleurochrysis_carterae.AAC.1
MNCHRWTSCVACVCSPRRASVPSFQHAGPVQLTRLENLQLANLRKVPIEQRLAPGIQRFTKNAQCEEH